MHFSPDCHHSYPGQTRSSAQGGSAAQGGVDSIHAFAADYAGSEGAAKPSLCPLPILLHVPLDPPPDVSRARSSTPPPLIATSSIPLPAPWTRLHACALEPYTSNPPLWLTLLAHLRWIGRVQLGATARVPKGPSHPTLSHPISPCPIPSHPTQHTHPLAHEHPTQQCSPAGTCEPSWHPLPSHPT